MTCINKRSAGIKRNPKTGELLAYADIDTSKEMKERILPRLPEDSRNFILAMVKRTGPLSQLEVRWKE